MRGIFAFAHLILFCLFFCAGQLLLSICNALAGGVEDYAAGFDNYSLA